MIRVNLVCIAAALVFVACLVPQVAFGEAISGHRHGATGGPMGEMSTGQEWMEDLTLIVTDAETIEEAYAAENAIEERGGSVAIIMPNRVMLGWVPECVAEELVGKAKIRHVSRKPLWARGRADFEASRAFNREEMAGTRFFNRLSSGRIKADMAAAKGRRPAMSQGPDGLEAPPLDYEDYRKNLLNHGISEHELANAGISIVQTEDGSFAPSPGNSDYMAGHAYFFLMYVESDGGIDENSYNWHPTYKTNVMDEVVFGLTWLSDQAKEGR